MTVEVDDGDWPVCLVHAAEKRQSDGMVTTHGDDTRQGLAALRLTGHVGVGGRLTHEDAVVAFLNLLDSPLVIVTGLCISRSASYPDFE